MLITRDEGEGMSLATTIMISSLLKDLSGGLKAVSVQMIVKIIYKIQTQL
jgi:hypothetical protein